MDAYKMNAAIAQFLDSFSNRDIAIWVWSIAFIAYLFVNKKFRGSLLRIIKCLLNIKLMIPIAGGLTIIVVVTYVLWKLNLWNVSILKDTIAYFFTANVVLFRYVGSNNRNFMEDALANVKATAIIAFYLNQASLNLIVELILVPVVVLLLLLQYIIQSKKSIGQPNICSVLFTAPHKKAEPAPLRLCLSLFSFYTAVILLLFSHKRSHRQELSYPLSWS